MISENITFLFLFLSSFIIITEKRKIDEVNKKNLKPYLLIRWVGLW
ncbi:MAG: hypothetical protein ACI97N_002735 [Cognaticolwellia sp.]|jgi:hypothetical protein